MPEGSEAAAAMHPVMEAGLVVLTVGIAIAAFIAARIILRGWNDDGRSG